MIKERNRQRTKSGTGRMPFNRNPGISGAKLWRGLTTLSNSYHPLAVTPPGETLAELLEERSIRQNELAVRMDVTPKFINELISGKANISPIVALSLERTLDIPADFWLTRDAHYQAYRARADAHQGRRRSLPSASGIRGAGASIGSAASCGSTTSARTTSRKSTR